MTLKHKVIQDFQFVTSDKKIIVLKSNSILENYTYLAKGSNEVIKMGTYGNEALTITGSQLVFNNNILNVNGVTLSRGGGSVATNIQLGSGSLSANTTGACNTAIGYLSANNITTQTNVLTVGYSSCTSANSNHTAWGNSSHTCHCITGTWTNVSDCRDKTNIQPLSPNMGLSFVNRLN